MGAGDGCLGVGAGEGGTGVGESVGRAVVGAASHESFVMQLTLRSLFGEFEPAPLTRSRLSALLSLPTITSSSMLIPPLYSNSKAAAPATSAVSGMQMDKNK